MGVWARDWAELNEPAWRPVFEAALDVAELTSGKLLLDIGCGAGGALVIARRRGAEVTGLDASANLAAIARKRLAGRVMPTMLFVRFVPTKSRAFGRRC